MELNQDTSKVLVVDDDFIILMANEEILGDYAAEVFTASDGQKALDVLEDHPDIDLVVSDWNMPNMDGIELFTAMRQRGLLQPFLMSSAQDATNRGKAEELFAADGNAIFLQKPLLEAELLAGIETLRPAPKGPGVPTSSL